MKKLVISLSAFLMLFIFGCQEQSEVTEPEYEFTEIAIPDNFKSDLKVFSGDVEIYEDDIIVPTRKGKDVYGKVRITFPANSHDCSVVKIELSNNIFQKQG